MTACKIPTVKHMLFAMSLFRYIFYFKSIREYKISPGVNINI